MTVTGEYFRLLPREQYLDPAVFETEYARVFSRQWLFAGHVSQLAEPGDYLVEELFGESVVVTRTQTGALKAFLNDTEMLTGQVYFPDALSARIYREREPYNRRPTPDTTNEQDFIFKTGEREGGGTVLAVAEAADVVTASLVIAVDRTGDAVRRAEGWGSRLRRWLGGRS